MGLPNSDTRATRAHLILGVPYQGAFLGTTLSTTSGTIAHSLLTYYKNTTIDIATLNHAFGYSYYPRTRAATLQYDLYSFFQKYGYQADEFSIEDPESIKSYIRRDIPVVVQQRLSLDAPEFVQTLRLAIGFSDEDGTITFHDNNFGNNYVMTYEAFDLLNLGSLYMGTAIYPKEEAGFMNTHTNPYPPRLAIMDDADLRKVQIAWVTADALLGQIDEQTSDQHKRELYEQMAQEWESIVFGPGFEKLHPAGRYVSSFLLARIYTNELHKHTQAIEVFTKKTIPLPRIHDFKQPFGGWERRNPEVYDDPWWKTAGLVGLGVASIRQGDMDAARKAFEEVLTLDPENEDALSFMRGEYGFTRL